MYKPSSGIRDHPGALVAALVALAAFIVGLGYLTARVGSVWAHTYAHKQTLPESP